MDNITVDIDYNQEQDTGIYNVKASAGDFIIGEVGRIDINSGQTLRVCNKIMGITINNLFFHGVRYTAVEGEVDQARISDILVRYLGTSLRFGVITPN